MIKSLVIRNWKAFEDKKLIFSDGITFFVGQNGVGKTTLLDAICLSITGECTAAKFQDLVRNAQFPAEVRLDFEVNGNQVSIARRFKKDRKLPSEIIIDGERKGMGWDDLTSAALDIFAVDEMFFNRLTFMSEGEVFRYLKEPPSKALNAKIQEIFGITNLQTLKEFSEKIRKNLSSSIRDISSELKAISPKLPADDSKIKEIESYLTERKSKEKKVQKERETLYSRIREIIEQKSNFESLRRLLTEITEKHGQLIAKTTKESFDEALLETINLVDADVASKENDLRKSETSVGSVQNNVSYLKDIHNLLQSVIIGTAESTEVPCPVCRRP